MKSSFSTLLTFGAVLALSACAAQHKPESQAPETRSSEVQSPTKTSGACRSIGEGRKINNKGKNEAYMCSASAALNSKEAHEVLNPAIKVSYGSTGNQTLVSRQVANSVGKTPDETCQRAFLSAVKRFQSTAVKQNAKSVRLVSYFDKQTKGGSEYECHIGTWNSRVVLKGSLH
ncbi:hypothetical protein [Neisseria wadsworthii]|uniref:hypothetical protein n=1 Tax=Neisseria wadsworthii TaxID=607711 RepID=UPI001F1892C0|nr:hypothetical protein [Neisseria wadsworthii]